MLLSFLICCSFRVITYIVKRIQVLIKNLTQIFFNCFTFPIGSLFFQTGFFRLVCKIAFYVPALIPSALVHQLCNHSEGAFSHSEAALHEQVHALLTLPKSWGFLLLPCTLHMSAQLFLHWQQTWGRKLIQAKIPWAVGEGESYFSTISVPSSVSTTLSQHSCDSTAEVRDIQELRLF